MLDFIRRPYWRLIYRLPRVLKDVWWHQAVWSKDTRFPIIKWEGVGYVECRKGVIMAMREIKKGVYAYYEVTKVRYSRGGDYIYDGDRYHCDMTFRFVKAQLGLGGVEQKDPNKTYFIKNNP